MESNANKNENVTPSPCSSEVDIAFSSNGEGKLTFSMCKPHPGFRIPSLPWFRDGISLARVLKDICECFIEQENASYHVGNKHPSFDNSTKPEKQGGPTSDPIQIPRFVVSNEFDHCFSGELRKQQMVGIDELSGSRSLTIISKEQSTVDICSKHFWVADITRGL
ncbi:hypothetical protein M8C21_009831 [Ambrosia artemisiifolia]|uniref:Uncharacterized protein n=1 Tax=Ambrosia artemisiifolia TaxID=4212 RepID=A0AAD5C461_AMBAR|nr:hypothetical protein M8C21_009831 [Ambrosia artemisiifolia]